MMCGRKKDLKEFHVVTVLGSLRMKRKENLAAIGNMNTMDIASCRSSHVFAE